MIVLKNAGLSDICDIMRIENASFSENIREDRKIFEERIRIFPEGFVLFCEEDDPGKKQSGKIQGYFSTELWKSVPEAESFSVGHSIKNLHSENGKTIYISSFALLPEIRGKGNGTRLFNEALLFIKEKLRAEKNIEIEREVLLVNEIWEGARHIYGKSGFKETRKIRNAFPDSEYGIVMERSASS